MKCVESSEIYKLTLGELDGDRVAALEHHFSHCETCAEAREEVRSMVGHLAPDGGEFDDPDFSGDVMTLIRLGQGRSAEPRPSWWSTFKGRWQSWVAVPLVAAATASLVILVWPQTEGVAPTFQARGGVNSPDSWVSIQAYRTRGKVHEPVTNSLSTDDALAFSYSNRSKTQHRFLMIFAVDQAGRVFWYYPAYVNPAEDPESIKIKGSENPQTLSQQVRHELRPGRLRLFGVFSDAPLRVRAMEAAIGRDLAAAGSLQALGRLNLDRTGQHSFVVEVRAEGPEAGGP